MTINTEEHFEKMKNIQESILEYIESENIEIGFISLEKDLQDLSINELKLTLHLLVEISNNYHRLPAFFTKIEKIIKYFQTTILQFFPNFEIFSIFQSNFIKILI